MRVSSCLIFLFLALSTLSRAQQKLLSPDEFLPHKLGEEFTFHHQLVDYFKHAATHSPLVTLGTYGQTNEKRPLIYAIVTSEENKNKVEEIRLNNLRRTGLLDDKAVKEDGFSIVWLSYGVHGNEAGASESSMAVIYKLAKGEKKIEKWLKNTIVIIDPCINPDGYSRYSTWNRQASNVLLNPHPASREHREPWPGGRVNHYLFDLNRDWAWLSQLETQQRLNLYHQWMPHVHVDYHEMGHEEHYYFAPAARPYHQQINSWQALFQRELGKNHAKYFDREGWLYFTRETFDLFYPSYGDTYPIFNGAIGMTYEQAGHSRAGKAILLENGDTLRLIDRIKHHLATSLSTIEVSSENAGNLSRNFSSYFKTARENPEGEYKSFVIKADNAPAKIASLCRFLDQHKIQYGKLKNSTKGIKAYHYTSGSVRSVDVNTEDLVISCHQPMGNLAHVLFEPHPLLEDSLTYDITAWALPYAYGLEAYASREQLGASEAFNTKSKAVEISNDANSYAWLLELNSLESTQVLAAALREGLKARLATHGFTLEGKPYVRGTLVFTRADNKHLKNNLAETLQKIAQTFSQELAVARTGFSDSGPDIGSDKMRLITAPKVLVLGGEKVYANNFGQVWHYFEADLEYPLSVVAPDQISGTLLQDYDLLIMPSGSYRLKEKAFADLKKWMREGGRTIVMERALRNFENKEGFHLKKTSSGTTDPGTPAERLLKAYHGKDRRAISNSMPGAIFKLKMDNSHPLAFGMPDYYFSLKTSKRYYDYPEKCWNVGTVENKPMVLGFVGAGLKKKMNNTMVFGVEEHGKGSVVYMVDNPLFRGFWQQGKFLFGNAVFFPSN